MVRTQPAERSGPVDDAAVSDDSPSLVAGIAAVSEYVAEIRRPRAAKQWLTLEAMLNNHLHERSSAVMGDESLAAASGSTPLMTAALVASGDAIQSTRGMERRMAR
jgi:hypothetical protein